MSPLRSTRMGLLSPCKDLCCSSVSLFTTWPFFRFVCILATSLTAGIFVYSRYLRLQQVSVFALTVGRFVLVRSTVRPRTGTKNIRAYCQLAGGPASLFWQTVALLLWFYLGTRGVPQNVVGASANSLWQGGWRRVHSVKGGLPK